MRLVVGVGVGTMTVTERKKMVVRMMMKKKRVVAGMLVRVTRWRGWWGGWR